MIVPTRVGGPYLRECLAHLACQTYAAFDIIVVSDEPLPADAAYRNVPSGAVLPNEKRQIGAAASDAEIVAFIDDDAYPDPHWLAAAAHHFSDPRVVAAGGPSITPPDDSAIARVSGAIFASGLVTASTRHRYVPEAARDIDALPSCNLLVRRELFLRDAEASARYWPGEDILSCMFAAEGGGRIAYDPRALVYHHRRDSFGAHLRQVRAYGFFRGVFLRRFSTSWSNGVYAAPAAFVVSHAAVAALLAKPKSRPLALSLVAAYAGLVAVSAAREARAARANPWLTAAGIYLTHLTYGAASIAGFVRGVSDHGRSEGTESDTR